MSEKIPKGWKWVKLGEVLNSGSFELLDRYRIPLSDNQRNKMKDGILYPYYGANGIIDYVNRYIFDGEFILVAEDGTVSTDKGKPVVQYVCGKFWVSNHAHVIKCENSITLKFLYYALKNVDIIPYITGAVQPKLNQRNLLDIEILYALDINEQKAIAEVLSSIDDKIDLLHRQNKTLEEMAMTLFRQWFIEPTKDGLPEGWEEVSLGEFIKEILGGDWGKEKPEGEYKIKVNCIRGTDISDLQDSLPKKTPVRFIKQSKFKSIEPKDGDIILEISGGTETQSTGRSIYISSFNRQLFEYPIIFSNFCRLLRPKENYYTYYLYLYLKYLYINDEFFSLENGTSGIKNLDYKTLLYDLKYPMPKNTEIYLSFHENVSILFEKIDKNKLQIQTLEKLRDKLLPKLMSGEVRIMNDKY